MNMQEIILDCVRKGWNVSFRPSIGNFGILIKISDRNSDDETEEIVSGIENIPTGLEKCYGVMTSYLVHKKE